MTEVIKNLETKNLSWSGYSNFKYIPINDDLCTRLALPHEFYRDLPMLHVLLDQLNDWEELDRFNLQKLLVENIEHSSVASIYMGMVGQDWAQWLRSQIQIAYRALFEFARVLACEGATGPTLQDFTRQLDPETAARFNSLLSTSCFNYRSSDEAQDRAYRQASIQASTQAPLFLDCGVDIMMGVYGPVLAEFQVRYLGPFPHLLNLLHKGYHGIYDSLMEGYQVPEDGFFDRRLQLFESVYQRVSEKGQKKTRKLLFDAWGLQAYRGGNNQELAQAFGMDYQLFDHQLKAENRYADLAEGYEKLFIFNQPPLYLLDPEEPIFDSVTREHLEEYPELGLRGLYRDYLAGKAYFINPPVFDILNDKGLYTFIPALARYFLNESVELPITDTRECWDFENPAQLNSRVIDWLTEHQEDAVLTHRYLEGGMGIKVGKVIAPDVWKEFIETYVRAKPHLYVVRSYCHLEPDCFLRSLVSGVQTPTASGSNRLQIEISKDFYCRVSPTSPLTSEVGHSLLVVESQYEPFNQWFSQQMADKKLNHPNSKPKPIPL